MKKLQYYDNDIEGYAESWDRILEIFENSYQTMYLRLPPSAPENERWLKARLSGAPPDEPRYSWLVRDFEVVSASVDPHGSPGATYQFIHDNREVLTDVNDAIAWMKSYEPDATKWGSHRVYPGCPLWGH
jgi:hypothetical protein